MRRDGMDDMEVIFFGSGAFGLPTLRALSAPGSGCRVVGVVTQPDKPAGRGGKLTPTPIGQFVHEQQASGAWAGVPIVKPDNCNAAEVVAQIRAWPARVYVVIAFGQYIGTRLLAERFAINLHGSLLPRWRGAAPIHHAILAGDRVTGNSVIGLAKTMDAGLVYGQTQREIPPAATTAELHDQLAEDGPGLVLRVLREHAAGTAQGAAQDERGVTLAGKLSRADGWVDFAQPAEACRCRINGLSPWPGVGAMLGGEAIKLLRAGPTKEMHTSAMPGTLLDAGRGLVACGAGSAVQVLEVQPPGKKPMAWGEFVRGRTLAASAVLASGPAHGPESGVGA